MSTFSRTLERMARPIDGASVAAYRALFGVVMTVSSLRFLWKGGVDRCFVEPIFFFKYYGFDWVDVASRPVMIGVVAAMAFFAACVAVGFQQRTAAFAFFLTFTYVHLIDVTNYLNHYYLVSLIALLLCVVPASGTFSLDARLGRVAATDSIPSWALLILRFQVATVYLGAALAKVGSDWLVHGEPIAIWMSSRADTPLIGALLLRHDVTVAMSWAGFLNDLLAVPLLSHRRTRHFGFAMILGFHALTGYFFNIGIFPVLMPIGALLFFAPDWPRTLARRLGLAMRDAAPATTMARPSRALALALGLWMAVQVLVPLRTFAYGGDVLWHEQGMRFSWRVMLRKKTGSITYRVRIPGRGRDVDVHPRRYLNDFQEREFAGQPDLILQLAHHIHDDLRARGYGDVQVRADAWVSLNGRPAVRMIDPEVDLARVPDGFAPASYILPRPSGPPARLAAR